MAPGLKLMLNTYISTADIDHATAVEAFLFSYILKYFFIQGVNLFLKK